MDQLSEHLLSEHLTDAQVEHYAERVSGTQAGPGRGSAAGQDQSPDRQISSDQDHEVETHLAKCPSCCARVLASMRSRLKRRTDEPAKDSIHPNCPGEEALRDLAAGLCAAEKAPALIEHATQCEYCGPILRMYTEDFDEDLNSEDQALLDILMSGSAEWRKNLIQAMRNSGKADKGSKR